MKLLHVAQIHWYNAEVQYAWDLAQRQAARGHEVHVLTRCDSLSGRKAAERGLILHEEDDFNAKGFGFLKTFAAFRRFGRLLDREGFDAVVIHRSEGLPFLAWACRRRGVPALRVRGDMRPVRSDPVNRFVYTRLLSGVVASNSVIEAGLRARLGPGLNAVTIHGGVDEREFSPDGPKAGLRAELKLPPDAFLIGLVGRMAAHKGFATFLSAAKEMRRAHPTAAFLVFVKGSLPLLPELRQWLEEDPALAEAVRILGHRADLPAALRDCNAAVVASTASEANCRVGLEWMASGVPLVASRVGTLPDLVEEGATGFLVPPADAPALAEALGRLAENPERARRMGLAARRRVEERFTLDGVARAHEEFLQKLLGG